VNADDALGRLVALMGKADVPRMIAGSFASTFHGHSRTTLDVDVIIDPTPESLSVLVDLLSDKGFYVSKPNARSALLSRGQFNVIHIETVWKIDLIIRKERAYSKTEFERRNPRAFWGSIPVWQVPRTRFRPSWNGRGTVTRSVNGAISRASSKSRAINWTEPTW